MGLLVLHEATVCDCKKMIPGINLFNESVSLFSVRIGDVDSIAIKKVHKWLPFVPIRIKKNGFWQLQTNDFRSAAVSLKSFAGLVTKLCVSFSSSDENWRTRKYKRFTERFLQFCQDNNSCFDKKIAKQLSTQNYYEFSNHRVVISICIQDMSNGADSNIFIVEIKTP